MLRFKIAVTVRENNDAEFDYTLLEKEAIKLCIEDAIEQATIQTWGGGKGKQRTFTATISTVEDN